MIELAAPPLGWGIVGAGWVAGMFTRALTRHTAHHVRAITAPRHDRATAFAARFGIPTVAADVREMLGDPEIDIVYVATPHDSHLPIALAVIEADRAVLVEKPLALSAAQATRLAEAAAARGVLAMEALWSSYLPRAFEVRRMLSERSIGEVALATAQFGAEFDRSPTHRSQDPARGGGVLLDLGVYHLAWARDVLGELTLASVTGRLSPTTVDDEATLVVDGTGGSRAVLTATMRTTLTGTASIAGTAGRIDYDAPFFLPGGLEITLPNRSHRWADESGIVGDEGLAWQAAYAARYLANGLTDSPIRPLAHAIADLAIIDQARAELGAARYPE